MGRGVDDALLVALVQDADGAPYPVEVLETARRDLGSTQSAGDAKRQNERVANAFDDVIIEGDETFLQVQAYVHTNARCGIHGCRGSLRVRVI